MARRDEGQVPTAMQKHRVDDGGLRSTLLPTIASKRKRRMPFDEEGEEEESSLEMLVNGAMFQWLMALVIFANAALIGLETDLPQYDWIWEPAEDFFLLVFLLELVLRLYVLGAEFFLSTEYLSNIFDVVLVLLGLFDFIFTTVFQLNLGMLSFFIQASRLLRVLRLFRLFRMIKQLYMLVSGFVASSAAVFWVSVLCALMLYICAIVLTRTMGKKGGNSPNRDNFRSVGASMFSLFELMTQPDLNTYEADMQASIGMMIFFITFVIFGSFAMLAILTGVISEGMVDRGAAHHDSMRFEQEKMKKMFQSKLENFFEQSDQNGDGMMSREEFEDRLPFVIGLFRDNGFDYSREDVRMVFDLVDFDGGGCVESEEFVEGMLSFVINAGDLPLKCLHLQSKLFHHLSGVEASFNERFEALDKLFRSVNKKLDALNANVKG